MDMGNFLGYSWGELVFCAHQDGGKVVFNFKSICEKQFLMGNCCCHMPKVKLNFAPNLMSMENQPPENNLSFLW